MEDLIVKAETFLEGLSKDGLKNPACVFLKQLIEQFNKQSKIEKEDKQSLCMYECLLACGVDNWQGYEYAVDMFEDECVDK